MWLKYILTLIHYNIIRLDSLMEINRNIPNFEAH